jgi:hypothetical protein
MVSAVNTLMVINKFMILVGNTLEIIGMNIQKYVTLSSNVYNNVTSFDVGDIYKSFVKPTMDKSVILNNVINKTGVNRVMNNYNAKRKEISYTYNKMGDKLNAEQKKYKNLI